MLIAMRSSGHGLEPCIVSKFKGLTTPRSRTGTRPLLSPRPRQETRDCVEPQPYCKGVMGRESIDFSGFEQVYGALSKMNENSYRMQHP